MARSEFRRGATLGVSLGALCGAALLVFFAQRLKTDCAGLAPADCVLEQEIQAESEHLALNSAGALALISMGGFAYTWLSRKKA
jgi:hypothetical protein